MVLVQKLPFFQVFFLGNTGKENVFYDILHRITAFVAYNKKVQKVEKLTFFQNALTHSFGPKLAIFQTFFLGNIGQENVFYDILHRKNAFVAYINKKFRKSKNWHFSKGLAHGFVLKMAVFPTFIF